STGGNGSVTGGGSLLGGRSWLARPLPVLPWRSRSPPMPCPGPGGRSGSLLWWVGWRFGRSIFVAFPGPLRRPACWLSPAYLGWRSWWWGSVSVGTPVLPISGLILGPVTGFCSRLGCYSSLLPVMPVLLPWVRRFVILSGRFRGPFRWRC